MLLWKAMICWLHSCIFRFRLFSVANIFTRYVVYILLRLICMAAKSWPVGFCIFLTSIWNRTENREGRVINKHIHVEVNWDCRIFIDLHIHVTCKSSKTVNKLREFFKIQIPPLKCPNSPQGEFPPGWEPPL